MLSIEHIREHPDEVRKALQTRGQDDSITEVLELDSQVNWRIVPIRTLRLQKYSWWREILPVELLNKGVIETFKPLCRFEVRSSMWKRLWSIKYMKMKRSRICSQPWELLSERKKIAKLLT